MFARTVIRRHSRDEAEKPFWISFSDLMTACMTVFLIVMAATVVSMKDEIAKLKNATVFARERQTEIEEFANQLRSSSEQEYPDVKVDVIKHTVKIDPGSEVSFISGS